VIPAEAGTAAAAAAAAEAAVAEAATDPATTLGIGLGYRAALRAAIFQQRGRIGFLEIIADHWLDPTWEQRAELDLLAEHFVLIPHAIGLSLGSADGLDGGYLERLAALVERLDPPWWSEHIAFTRAGGVDIGHLTPLPCTREAVAVLARNVAQARRSIAAPLILENSAALFRLPGEMDEAAFTAAVVEATGCGLLLDVANLHCNAVNHGYDARAALDRIPLERVVQLHIAGGHVHDGVLIDSHSRPTPAPVWSLVGEVLARGRPRGVVLERDARLPPFAELAAELDHAARLWREAGR
jgi:hypothetical protein